MKTNKFIEELSRRSSIDSMVYTSSPPAEHVASMAAPTPSIRLRDKDIRLIPPPHNTCEKVKDELMFLEKITSNLSKEDKVLIRAADDRMIEDIFMVDYNWPDKDKIIEQLYLLNNEVDTVILKQKYKFNRPRPQQLAEALGYDINIFESLTTKTPAYPSGHTTLAYVIAYISSDMNPSKRDEDLEKANLVAKSRLMMGAHYPSDNEASIALAKQIYLSIKKEWFKE